MEPILVTLDDACNVLGIKKTKLYSLLGSDLRAVKIGRRTLVTTSSIRDFVASREAA